MAMAGCSDNNRLFSMLGFHDWNGNGVIERDALSTICGPEGYKEDADINGDGILARPEVLNYLHYVVNGQGSGLKKARRMNPISQADRASINALFAERAKIALPSLNNMPAFGNDAVYLNRRARIFAAIETARTISDNGRRAMALANFGMELANLGIPETSVTRIFGKDDSWRQFFINTEGRLVPKNGFDLAKRDIESKIIDDKKRRRLLVLIEEQNKAVESVFDEAAEARKSILGLTEPATWRKVVISMLDLMPKMQIAGLFKRDLAQSRGEEVFKRASVHDSALQKVLIEDDLKSASDPDRLSALVSDLPKMGYSRLAGEVFQAALEKVWEVEDPQKRLRLFESLKKGMPASGIKSDAISEIIWRGSEKHLSWNRNETDPYVRTSALAYTTSMMAKMGLNKTKVAELLDEAQRSVATIDDSGKKRLAIFDVTAKAVKAGLGKEALRDFFVNLAVTIWKTRDPQARSDMFDILISKMTLAKFDIEEKIGVINKGSEGQDVQFTKSLITKIENAEVSKHTGEMLNMGWKNAVDYIVQMDKDYKTKISAIKELTALAKKPAVRKLLGEIAAINQSAAAEARLYVAKNPYFAIGHLQEVLRDLREKAKQKIIANIPETPKPVVEKTREPEILPAHGLGADEIGPAIAMINWKTTSGDKKKALETAFSMLIESKLGEKEFGNLMRRFINAALTIADTKMRKDVLDKITSEKKIESRLGKGGLGSLFKKVGNARLENKDYPGAIACYDQAIKLYPKDSEAYQKRGIAKQKSGDQPGAELDFERAKFLERSLR